MSPERVFFGCGGRVWFFCCGARSGGLAFWVGVVGECNFSAAKAHRLGVRWARAFPGCHRRMFCLGALGECSSSAAKLDLEVWRFAWVR